MKFQAVESLSQQIAQYLGMKIIHGHLKPKQRIQELTIANKLNVSRGSVRESLLILERRHLVTIVPRKGAMVSELSTEHVNGLYDIYIELLTLLIVKLVDKAYSIEKLQSLIQQTELITRLFNKESQPIEDIVNSGFELMQMCYPLVGNPYLSETLDNFRPAISRTFFLVLQTQNEHMQQTKLFFQKLMRAVLSQNKLSVEQTIKDFGELQRKLVLQNMAIESELGTKAFQVQ